MSINLVVAVTDNDWFEMLRKQPNLSEVNFWAPSAANFRALQPGEMFLFKLHAPRNAIVGGGIFAYLIARGFRTRKFAASQQYQKQPGR
jgi:putative restriction endonuclease